MASSIEEIALLPPPARIGYLLKNELFCTTKFKVLFSAHLKQNEESGEKDAGLRHPSVIVPFIFSVSPRKINADELALFYHELIPNSRIATPDLPQVSINMFREGAPRDTIEAALACDYSCSPYSVLQKVIGMARIQGQDGPALWDVPPYLIDWVQSVLSEVRTEQAPALDALLHAELKSGAPSPRSRRALKLVRAIQLLTPLVNSNTSSLRVLLLSAAHPGYLAAHNNPHPDPDLEHQAEHALFAAYTATDHPNRCEFERVDEGLFFSLLVYLVFCDTPDSPWRYQNCNYLRRAVCWDFSFPAMIALSYASAVIHGMLAAPFYSTSFLEHLLKYNTTLEKHATSASSYVAPGVLDIFNPTTLTPGLFDHALTIYDCSFGEFRLQPRESWVALNPGFAVAFARDCRHELMLDEINYYAVSAPDDAYLLKLAQYKEKIAEQKRGTEQEGASSSAQVETVDDEKEEEEEEEEKAPAEWYYSVQESIGSRYMTSADYDAFFSKDPPMIFKVSTAINDLLEERAELQNRKRKRRRK